MQAVDAGSDSANSPVFSVDHYGTDGITDTSAVIEDPVAARMAYELGLTGPLFDPAPNPTNILLADRLDALGITYNPLHSSAYDSVSLLADSILLSSDQYPVMDVLDSSSSGDTPTPFPYMGALGGTDGITLDDSGDLKVDPSDYVTFTVTSSGIPPDTTYSWQSASTTISGTVFSDANGNGVQDTGELGIEGHRMLAIDYSTLDIVEAYTAPDGSYSFDLSLIHISEPTRPY